MHQRIRAAVAAAVAVGAILIAAATSSSAATPIAAPPSSAPGIGAACVVQQPDCEDRLPGGGSAPGSPGDGAQPPTVAPSPGCGPAETSGPDVGVTGGPDTSVATVPCIPGPERRPQPLVVVPRSGMDNVRPIAFTSAAVRDDDRTVDVRFWSGIEPCSVLDHVDVAYGSDTVTITLFDGSDPSAGLVACPDIAMLKQVTVPLEQALAGRTLADGAA